MPLWWALNAVLLAALIVASVIAVRASHLAPAPAPAPAALPTVHDVTDVARDIVVGILSYTPDTVEQDVDKAAQRTTGDFHDYYQRFTHEQVIPAARSRRITTKATVPRIGVENVSATAASMLAFVNQQIVTGDGEPSVSTSSVRVKMLMVNGVWLVSAFDPL